MLLTRFLKSCRRAPSPVLARPDAEVREDLVEDLAGFNKLVRGRRGVFVANNNDIYIGRALIEYGEFCEIEWQLLAPYCKYEGVVVEVGANIGAHTVNIAKAVGPGGRVVAIEPQPIVFQSLCANLALNSILNVDALNCACADTSRLLLMPPIDYGHPGNFGGVSLVETNASSGLRVRCEPLDDLLQGFDRIDLIKIDVEGMELDVIAGASRVIQRFMPVLYVENDRPKKSRQLIECLHALGYRAWWHIPPLYNPNNYYSNTHNLYPNVCSFNMLCMPVHASSPVGLAEVDESADHPLSRPE